MGGVYVEAPIVTSEAQLQEEALAKLTAELEKAGVVGYVPKEAELAIIVLKVLATMAQNAAIVASTVLNAVFTQFGVQLVKVPVNEGASATAKTLWTVVSSEGVRTIEAGTQIEAGGQGFRVEVNTEVKAKATSVELQVVALERGTVGNKISGVANQVNPYDWVTEVQIVGETTGGQEEETAEEYRNRLVAALQLQAPRPITASNFAEMTVLIPESTLGLIVGRATCIDGYSPESAGKGLGNLVIEAKTNSSTTLTEVSTFTGVSLESLSLPQKHPGSELHWKADGAEYKVLPRGTTAVSKPGAGEMKISVAALKSEAKGKIEVIGAYEQQRTVTVFVAKTTGHTAAENEYSSEVRAKIQAYLEERRELGFLVYVASASYSEVRVKGAVHVEQGYTEASVVANVKAAVEALLAPGTWGNPSRQTTGSTSWLNATQGANLVRYNQVVEAMASTPGVQYVPTGSAGLAIGLEEAPGSKVVDLVLPGPAPLPTTKAANVEITAV
jgi:Baseplate J-like protein